MGIRHWVDIVGQEEFDRQMAAIKATAAERFPDQIVEVVSPEYPDLNEGAEEWHIFVGPERESSYLVHELQDGSFDFEQVD